MKKIPIEAHLKGKHAKEHLQKALHHFTSKEVKMGVEDEKEHTPSPVVAGAIALTHLLKEPHYYEKMKAAHIESTNVFDFNFHDILEIVWDDPEDRPLAMVSEPQKPKVSTPAPVAQKKPSEEPGMRPTTRAGRKAEIVARAETARAKEREDLIARHKDSDPQIARVALSMFDKSPLSIHRGRPKTGDSNKHRLGIYASRNIPKVDQRAKTRVWFDQKMKSIEDRTGQRNPFRLSVGKQDAK